VEFVPTTFIIDRQGNIAQKIPEARSKADFIKLIKPLL
jgi:peroxiredoxin